MTTDVVGGVWTFSMELCRSFSRLGIAVTLATLGGKMRPSQRKEAASIPLLAVEESEFALEWMPNPWRDLDAAVEWLFKIERFSKPDVIHANSFGSALVPWKAPVLLSAHSCVRTWWRATRGGPAPEAWIRYSDLVRSALDHADVVVSPTRAFLAMLQQEYGPITHAHAIPNGCASRYTLEAVAARKPFILGVGRFWDEAKNVALLAEVAPDLPWKIALAGSWSGPGGIIEPPETVDALGFCAPDALASLYGRASLFASPARYEPFGLSILEAAQFGCPLVLSDLPTLRETWEGAAAFVRPNDRECWRATLLDLIHDEPRRRHLSTLALERSRVFSAERMAAAYRDLYLELLGGSENGHQSELAFNS